MWAKVQCAERSLRVQSRNCNCTDDSRPCRPFTHRFFFSLDVGLTFAQLQKLDLKESLNHFHAAHEPQAKHLLPFQPVDPTRVVRKQHHDQCQEGWRVGIRAIAEGKVAAVIMSGGQGTRLGFHGPKGIYSIGLPSDKSIFQIHIERIQRIRQLAAGEASSLPRVAVYIMTSDLNHATIVEYFEANGHFGYPKEDIVFFEQGLEPCFSFDGKVILESDRSISLAPDGNGGLYKALRKSGCFEDIKARGIEHLHIYGIDNVLTKSLDPAFIGLCALKSAQCGNKVVWRASKSEKVGVTAELDEHMHILEYSEIPAALAETEDSAGMLLFGAANICNHYLSVAFLQDVVLPQLSGIYHIAKKKIPYYNPETHQTATPDQPNGVKLEMFIFDVFPMAERWIVMETERAEEFAPVKNEPGNPADSPDTARQMMSDLARRYFLLLLLLLPFFISAHFALPHPIPFMASQVADSGRRRFRRRWSLRDLSSRIVRRRRPGEVCWTGDSSPCLPALIMRSSRIGFAEEGMPPLVNWGLRAVCRGERGWRSRVENRLVGLV